jgi:hypothetical protein
LDARGGASPSQPGRFALWARTHAGALAMQASATMT